MDRSALRVLLLLLAFPAVARAQEPVGEEFQINTYTTYAQYSPFVAMTPGGDSLVVWYDSARGGRYSQRFLRDGTPLGGEVRLPEPLTWMTDVAVRRDGRSIFVGLDEDGGGPSGVFAQLCDPTGAVCAAPLRVNTYTTGQQTDPAVAVSPAGDFLLVWSSAGQDNGTWGVFARRLSRSGLFLGPEFRVNTYTTGAQGGPSVASDRSGHFVVVWSSTQDGGRICGQRFSASGARLGAEFVVNGLPDASAGVNSVAADAEGGFVVAWVGSGSDGPDIIGQRLDPGGARLGAEFRVNSYTTSIQWFPSIRMNAVGSFAILWHDEARDTAYGQRYNRDGSPRGAEFRVSTYTASLQNEARLSMDAAGNLLAAWTSYIQDGSQSGIFGRRFGGIHVEGLSVDAAPTARSDGNRILEPGERVIIAPSWFNATGTQTTFSGHLSLGESSRPWLWDVGDPDAHYGPVAASEAASCESAADCYSVSLRDTPIRPTTHWDGFVHEELDRGLGFEWVVHVGESFRDVPRASPFYGQVETLLHQGVTSGCTFRHYCPESLITRAQMAAFLLLAKEGVGFVPPRCRPSPFGDVPLSHPFCPWIKELAARGVTGGCGGDNYCPEANVSREQMAVFLLRTLDATLLPPACETPMFSDVPASSPFCRWIEELARRGVVAGCGGGNYCPTTSVDRQQMAAFLVLTFSLSLYGT